MVRKKLKGSTLIETLIAMLIISVAFAGGLYTLARLDIIHSTGAKAQTRMILQDELNATQVNQRYFDEVYDHEGITIVKKIIGTSNQDVLLLKVEGYIDDKLYGAKSEVVILK